MSDKIYSTVIEESLNAWMFAMGEGLKSRGINEIDINRAYLGTVMSMTIKYLHIIKMEQKGKPFDYNFIENKIYEIIGDLFSSAIKEGNSIPNRQFIADSYRPGLSSIFKKDEP